MMVGTLDQERTMSHPLQCQCGTIRGFVNDTRNSNRVICYCNDCQAFQFFLGREQDALDERGGSDVIQVLPKNITFTQGIEALACIRLTDKGLLRWYASCCKTPIGNTLHNPKFSFIGLVHSCLNNAGPTLDDSFGPVSAWVYTKRARGNPKPKQTGLGSTARWFITTVIKARFNGDYKQTPFFLPGTSTPIATPRVLTSTEHANVMKAVRTAAGQE
jgi:hypothetical protein